MTTQKTRHNAFTLMELLIVITIIAILASVMVSKFSQAQENGWATQCKGNLRALFLAAQGYQTDHNGNYPHAGPWEAMGSGWSLEAEAWVNWTTADGRASSNVWTQLQWPCTDPHARQQLGGPYAPACCVWWWGDFGRVSIQTGTLWDYADNSLKIYCCPKFKNLAQGIHADVVRSYAMNSVFGCETKNITASLSYADQITHGLHQTISFRDPNNTNPEPSRTLMFADMQPQATALGSGTPVCTTFAGNGNDPDGNDGVLDATTPPNETQTPYESVGFIHRMGGMNIGHAVFMDGHIESLSLPQPDGTTKNRTQAACFGQY